MSYAFNSIPFIYSLRRCVWNILFLFSIFGIKSKLNYFDHKYSLYRIVYLITLKSVKPSSIWFSKFSAIILVDRKYLAAVTKPLH